jgi:hypothetical protein
MCETAANWVDRLLPAVGYRQWVLSFDSSMAVRLGYDAEAIAVVCRSWTRRVMQRIARRVKREYALALQRSARVTRAIAPPRLVVGAHGMNLHAATIVGGRDRRRLVRRAGVFANRHRLRAQIVPTAEGPIADPSQHQLPLFDMEGRPRLHGEAERQPSVDPVRMPRRSWSWLLAHVFAIDITNCSRLDCGGTLEIVRVVRDPSEVASLLHGARARPTPAAPGQLGLLPT